MAFISPVKADDVHCLVRKVEYPAHQDTPLYHLMFPQSEQDRGKHTEDEIRWTIDGLLEAVHQGHDALYKICGSDGSPVGLIGWTTSPGASVKGEAGQSTRTKSKSSWTPPSLDVTSWLDISKRLRKERQRVLETYQGNGIYRITFMAVDPAHQRQGIGSMLMDMFCREVDEHKLDAFVLSSPAGVRLYTKSGFRAVGAVETERGRFTSMLRASSLDLGSIPLPEP